MHILKNRITISLVIIFILTFLWEFYVKPVSGPLYTEAVSQYKAQHYARSVQLLNEAYRIDPNDTAILGLFGWDYLKSGKPSEAIPFFERSLRLNPKLDEPREGLAYCWLEMEDAQKALDYFNQLPANQRNSEAIMTAEAQAYRLAGDNRTALRLNEAVLRADQDNKLARKELALLTGSEDLASLAAAPGTPYARPSTLMLAARVQDGYFHVPQRGALTRIFIVGVDLSPATPGNYPSSPPTETAVYEKWLEEIGAMGANAVGAYALLPPGFYAALLRYNSAHQQSPLYLFQGISAKDPPGDNLFDNGFVADFRKDLQDVVDAIHGQASIPGRPGSFGGLFSSDVSPYVVGWLVGRAMEPHLVVLTNLRNPGVTTYRGHYLNIANGNPSEVWFASMCDFAVDYEVTKYNWERPVAFVNTTSLDPLNHPTESRTAEELAIRGRLGEKELPRASLQVDDDDSVSLDPTKLKPTDAFRGGVFAAYSIYPYYPDFMNLDRHYVQGQDTQGPSSFQAYLEELRKYHKDMPLLVSAFGIPSSLGISHFSPLGWNAGGHTETEQGNFLARMVRSVAETGCAGGLMQGWLDEWFRSNWLVRDFEIPGGRSRLWLNTLSPDANQGLEGFRPARGNTYQLRGDASRWASSRLLYEKASGAGAARDLGDRYDPARRLLRLYVDSDEAYLYLRLDVQNLDNDGDGKPDWNAVNYLIALGTTPDPTGSVMLPYVSNVRVPSGVDFVVRLGKPDESKILVSSAYDPYNLLGVPGIPDQTQIRYRIPFLPALRPTAPFQEMTVEPNRRRYGRDGHIFPPVRYSRSSLRWGTTEPASPDYNTLAEWYANAKTGIIELRLPWGLLRVTDPSSLQVLGGIDRGGTFYSATTKGIQLAVVSYQPRTQQPADVLPRFRSPGVIADEDLKRYTWAPWDTVAATPYLKDGYYVVQRALHDLRLPRKGELARDQVRKGGVRDENSRSTARGRVVRDPGR